MNKKTLLAVLTSEKTWKRTDELGLRADIENAREKFDLAIVVNGNSPEAREFYDALSPEFYLVRENTGMDPAAMEFLLKNVPVRNYDYAIILHDDHFFGNPRWFESLEKILENSPDADVLGNILPASATAEFLDYLEARGLDYDVEFPEFDILQGMAGVFSRKAISELKKIKFGFELSNDKTTAEFGERIFSLAITNANLKMKQIGEKVFGFLKHSRENEKNYYYWNGFFAFMKKDFAEAEKPLKIFINEFSDENEKMLWFVYAMLTTITFSLGKYAETIYFANEAKARGFSAPVIDSLELKARELLNV